jgi:hypothetical protein
MRVMGLDVGLNNGFCEFLDGEYKSSFTLTPLQTFELIRNIDRKTVIVMEDSRLQSKLWLNELSKDAVRLKIARDVGSIDCLCRIYEQMVSENDFVELVSVSPKAKGSKCKTTGALFAKTGIVTSPKNQHERDAVLIAYPFRNCKPSF